MRYLVAKQTVPSKLCDWCEERAIWHLTNTAWPKTWTDKACQHHLDELFDPSELEFVS